MKSITFCFTLFITALAFGQIQRPMASPSAKVEQKVGLTDIKIEYYRPSKNNRTIFGDVVPLNETWRTGANEAAELTLYTDMMLGSTKIEAGTYTFYLIPGDKKWTAIVSTDLNVWGSYFYNEKNDVARVDVPVTKGKENLEAFSIAFEKSDNGIHMHIGWGTIRIAVPFTK